MFGHHTLCREQRLPGTPEEVFPFFADAGNLEAITPPWLGFSITTPRRIHMHAGAVIEYRLALHGLPIRWLTQIEAWEPGVRFVDRQLRGPFALWHHTHDFEAAGGGATLDAGHGSLRAALRTGRRARPRPLRQARSRTHLRLPPRRGPAPPIRRSRVLDRVAALSMLPAPRMTGASDPEDVVPGRALRVLLVEDDDGDALLVQDLLRGLAARRSTLQRAPRWPRPRGRCRAASTACCSTSACPTPTGLEALRSAAARADQHPAVFVLTGPPTSTAGVAAVAEGAQDYLVKGQVDGVLLAARCATPSSAAAAEHAAPAARGASCAQAENARLERGLLPHAAASTRRAVGRAPRATARAAGARCSAATSSTWCRAARRHGARRSSATSAATAPTRPRSASRCASPGGRWCSPAPTPDECCAPLERGAVHERHDERRLRDAVHGQPSTPDRAGRGPARGRAPAAAVLAGGRGDAARRRRRPAARRRRRRALAGDRDRAAAAAGRCCSTPTG